MFGVLFKFCYSSVFITAVLQSTFILTRQLDIKLGSSENWHQFYKRYCGRVCNNGSVHIVSNYSCQNPSCFPCDCDPSCSLYGTCCPTLNSTADNHDGQTHISKDLAQSQSHILPTSDRFVCDTFPGSHQYFYMISDCPTDYVRRRQQQALHGDPSNIKYATTDHQGNTDIQTRCENSNLDTFDDLTPYLDLRHGITFKNKFCAKCNGYTTVTNNSRLFNNPGVTSHESLASAWTLQVSCKHFQNVYHATSQLELVQAAIDVGRDQCNIAYTQPNITAKARKCSPEMTPVNESTCSSSDPRLQNYCFTLKQKYLLVHGGQNVFCYLCSGRLQTANICDYEPDYSSVLDPKAPRVRPPFSILLGPDSLELDTGSSNEVTCNNSNQWVTEKGDCEQAECSAGKLLSPDGPCKTALTDILGLGYKLFVVLKSKEQHVCTARTLVKLLMKKVYTVLSDLSDDVQLEANVTVLVTSGGTVTEELLQNTSILAHFIGNRSYNRDYLENKLLELLENDWIINLPKRENFSTTLTPIIFGTEKTRFFQNVKHFSAYEYVRTELNETSLPHFLLRGTTAAPIYDPCSISTDTSTTNLTSSAVKLYHFYFPARYSTHEQWNSSNKFIDVTRSLTCPFVTVNATDITHDDLGIKITFLFKDTVITATSSSDMSLVNGELRICLDLFKNLTTFSQTIREDYLAVATLYLQLTCGVLSIICLIITFVTYCLFPTLRTLPGLNNMSLAISLAVAQTLLLITSQFGVPGHLQPSYCLIHAIALHYSWLVSFMWMSACCIHMYRSFTSQGARHGSYSSDRKRYLRYCLYAFGSPVIIVVLLIVVCLGLTSGESIGYSNTICFLDIETFVWIKLMSIIVPLCFTVLSNWVLFFLTVREIMYVSSLQKQKRDGQGVITYAKLSTLTGIFYIVCGVALHLKSPILYLLTSPLMCLQGVFIFMSFIFNKRVGNLYLGRLDRSLESSGTTSSYRRTVLRSGTAKSKSIKSNTESTSV